MARRAGRTADRARAAAGLTGAARGRTRLLACAALALVALVAVGWPRAAAAEPQDQVLPYGEVNFSRGFVRVSAVGLPPLNSTDADAARQNAVSAAQKRLLAVVLDMRGSRGKLRDQLARHPELKEQLRAIVTSADVKGKAFADGSVEVTLTVPTDGPAGLRALLAQY